MVRNEKRRVKQCVNFIRSNRDPMMMLMRCEAEKWKNYPLQLKQDIAHLLKKRNKRKSDLKIADIMCALMRWKIAFSAQFLTRS